MKRPFLRHVALAAAAVSACWSLAASAADDTDPLKSILARNATAQAQIWRALNEGRMDPLHAAQVQQRAAEVYKQQAEVLSSNPGDEEREKLRQAQRDLAGAIAWAEKHPARNKGTDEDRLRLAVATARDAEQQRLIARGYASGQLSAEQVATLQEAQARVVAAQYDEVADGTTTRDEARLMQGAQNVLEYSILHDPSVASLVSVAPEGQESAVRND